MKPSDLVKVKPLVWATWRSYDGLMTLYHDPNGKDVHVVPCSTLHVADGVKGVRYHICRRKEYGGINKKYFLDIPSWILHHPVTWSRLADAKAACQAHYDSMIYELLEVR